MKLIEEVSPVFICGLNRTGTTLLMALLDGHPQMVVAPSETHFFLHFLPTARHLSQEKRIKLAREILLEVIDTDNMYYQKFLSHVPVGQTVDVLFELSQSAREVQDLLPAAIFAYGLASNQVSQETRYWVEKTPSNEFFADLIFRFWPNAKCIHMVRDPRDHFASLKMRARRNGEPLPSPLISSLEWLRSVKQGKQNSRIYGVQRYLLIRFEDLLRSPEEVMEVICSFLSIEKHSSLFAPTKGGGKVDWAGNAANGKVYGGIDPSVIGRWTRVLTSREVLTIESSTANMMKTFSYDITYSAAFVLQVLLRGLFPVYHFWRRRDFGKLYG